jgi:hypothetical protein
MNILRVIHLVLLITIRLVVRLGSVGPFSSTGANVTTSSLSKSSPAVQNEGSVMAPSMLESIAWWRQCGDAGGCGPSDATMTGRLLLVCVVAVLTGVGTAWCKCRISPGAWVSLVLCVIGFCSRCLPCSARQCCLLIFACGSNLLGACCNISPCLLLSLSAFTFKHNQSTLFTNWCTIDLL